MTLQNKTRQMRSFTVKQLQFRSSKFFKFCNKTSDASIVCKLFLTWFSYLHNNGLLSWKRSENVLYYLQYVLKELIVMNKINHESYIQLVCFNRFPFCLLILMCCSELCNYIHMISNGISLLISGVSLILSASKIKFD